MVRIRDAININMRQEDMLHLVYKCEKRKLHNQTAIIFPDEEYEDFLKHYGMHLKIMQACMQDQNFADSLNKMLVVYELKR
jgi:hypothetical protein